MRAEKGRSQFTPARSSSFDLLRWTNRPLKRRAEAGRGGCCCLLRVGVWDLRGSLLVGTGGGNELGGIFCSRVCRGRGSFEKGKNVFSMDGDNGVLGVVGVVGVVGDGVLESEFMCARGRGI
jgi:hypothetical protein